MKRGCLKSAFLTTHRICKCCSLVFSGAWTLAHARAAFNTSIRVEWKSIEISSYTAPKRTTHASFRVYCILYHLYHNRAVTHRNHNQNQTPSELGVFGATWESPEPSSVDQRVATCCATWGPALPWDMRHPPRCPGEEVGKMMVEWWWYFCLEGLLFKFPGNGSLSHSEVQSIQNSISFPVRTSESCLVPTCKPNLKCGAHGPAWLFHRVCMSLFLLSASLPSAVGSPWSWDI